MAMFVVPDWMTPLISHMIDLGGNKPEDLVRAMENYKGKAGALRSTPEGQAIAADVQVGLLMRLRVAGLLKDPTAK
jgi:hypothetical protein